MLPRRKNNILNKKQVARKPKNKMSKIIGELNARVRRRLFEEELQKNNNNNSYVDEESNSEQQTDPIVETEKFYDDDDIGQQNETVAEFLELCNNDEVVNTTTAVATTNVEGAIDSATLQEDSNTIKINRKTGATVRIISYTFHNYKL